MHSMFPVWANTKGLATMALAAATVGLTACGGGGGSGGSASTAVTGTFVDAKVQGLGYKCGSASSLSGSTNASGEFTCQSGEAVSFYVGGIKLGAVSAIQTVVTPLDLVGAGATPASPKVKNIVRFLMSISSTLPSGGLLTIPSTVATAASAKSIDFTLDAPSNLDTVIGDVKPTGATTFTVEQAEAHLRSSISGLFAGDFSGSYSGGGESGTWTFTVNNTGGVDGVVKTIDGDVLINGSMTTDPKAGATSIYAFTGTAGDATWTGTLNLNTRVFSGTWSNPSITNGTFTGKTAAKPATGTTASGGGSSLDGPTVDKAKLALLCPTSLSAIAFTKCKATANATTNGIMVDINAWMTANAKNLKVTSADSGFGVAVGDSCSLFLESGAGLWMMSFKNGAVSPNPGIAFTGSDGDVAELTQGGQIGYLSAGTDFNTATGKIEINFPGFTRGSPTEVIYGKDSKFIMCKPS